MTVHDIQKYRCPHPKLEELLQLEVHRAVLRTMLVNPLAEMQFISFQTTEVSAIPTAHLMTNDSAISLAQSYT